MSSIGRCLPALCWVACATAPPTPAAAPAPAEDAPPAVTPLRHPVESTDPRRGGAPTQKSAPLPLPAPPPPLAGPERAEGIRALALDLGPVPKTVVVREGTAFDRLREVAAIPNTWPGFRLAGGNTLMPEDVARLSTLPRVHFHLDAPVLPIHLAVLRKVVAERRVTVWVADGVVPEPATLGRMDLASPGYLELALRGEVTPARLAPLRRLRLTTLTVSLPANGFDRPTRRALARLAARLALQVEVEATTPAATLAGLAGLPVARLFLVAHHNRIPPAWPAAVARLGARNAVVLDRRLIPEDLPPLRDLPRLELVVRLDDRAGIPRAVLEVLRASEGDRAPGPPGADAN